MAFTTYRRCIRVASNLCTFISVIPFLLALSFDSANAQSNADFTLEEVVVTAEKVNRSLKDTATSVAVLDGSKLGSKAGLDSLDDVLIHIPNVTETGNGMGATVRGVDGTGPAQAATALLAGTRNRVNIQIDGRPITYNEAVYGDSGIYDVQQIEVLRGVQSTLQGRNSIAGAVAIKTNDPTFDLEGGALLATGSYDFARMAGHISGPIVGDQVAGRLAVDHQGHESWVNMMPYAQESDPSKKEMTTVRGKVLVMPSGSDDFSMIVTAQHSKYRGPQVEYVRAPYSNHVSGTVPSLGPGEPVWRIDTNAVVAVSTWELSENVALENTLSYTDYKVSRSIVPGTGIADIGGHEWVVEPRVRASLLNGRIDWLSGIFYFNSRQSDGIDIIGGLQFNDRTRTSAVFTEADFSATDRFSISLGARYETETRVRFDVQGPFDIDLDKTERVFLPKFGLSYDLSDGLRVGAIASRGFNGGGAGFTFNPPLINFTYEPEYLWNYELYLRANPDDRLTLMANLFYSDYDGMQLAFDMNPGPAFSAVIINADDVRVHGAEVGIRWLPFQELELFADLGWQRNDLDAPSTIIDGQQLSRAPEWTAALGGLWRHSSGFEASIDTRYSSGYFSNVVNLTEEYVGSYWSANARIAYSLSENFEIFASSTNLFDSDAPVHLLEAGLTEPLASLIHPRMLSVGGRIKF